MKAAAIILLGAVTTWPYDGPGVAGTINEDTTWAGEVYVAGDIYVTPGATLTLEPGTKVVVARHDALSRPFVIHGATCAVEVDIAGTMKALGTAEAPVVFKPEPDGWPEESWAGLELRDAGKLTGEHVWLVGARGSLPRDAELGPAFYTIKRTRHKNEKYYPYVGVGSEPGTLYFYTDGAIITKDVIKKNRGFSRWIIAPSLSLVGFSSGFLMALGPSLSETGPGPSFWENYSIFILTPLFFSLGYLGGREIDNNCGARRAQDGWLKEHPDFTPPF